jgi:phosphocarrier protein HPr
MRRTAISSENNPLLYNGLNGGDLFGNCEATMPESMETRTLVVGDPLGIHLRPASVIAQTVRNGKSKVTIAKGDYCVNASDMLQVMTLAAPQGAVLTVTAEGEDAITVLDLLEVVFAGCPDEDNKENTT